MSSGGGKGGKKETETTIPSWIQQPAERNIRRAEQVQQLKYMPYTGAEVAAFNETQNAAMNNNIGAAKAFGLLDPNSTLTATSGMPTPTTYDNGMKGYGSIGLYDQALKELTARDPANMNAYNNLFGNAVPANVARSTGGGRGGGGSISFGGQPSLAERVVIANQTKYGADRTITQDFKGGKGRKRTGGAADKRQNYVKASSKYNSPGHPSNR
jgi:hypothetical protein